mmetsp:Transcript_30938/g.91998  ORF Transcript_30938/g.91998 Transcript_30938/m.91998 type:complete len:299 (-) Transcript_30938:276-1172(-)
MPAVSDLARLAREKLVDLVGVCGRDTQVGSASVQDAAASALVAGTQLAAVNVHCEDLHLPVTEFWLEHRHPRQRLQQPGGIVTANGNLTLLTRICVRQKHSEVGVVNLAACSQQPEEAEVCVESQTVKAQAQDAVKVKQIKRPPRHVNRHDHLRIHARPRSLAGQTEPALLRPPCRAQADGVTRKLAGDLAGAETDGHLVAEPPGFPQDRTAVQVDGQGAGGLPHVVAAVLRASLRPALDGWQDYVPGASVEHHPELLRSGAADVDDSGIGGLEGHHLTLPPYGVDLPPQLHQVGVSG